MRRKAPAQWITNLKIGTVAAVLASASTVAMKAWDKLDLVNNATAQTKATAERALELSSQNAQRIENIDAGTRQAVENLRRELAESRAETERKLDAILAKVEKHK
jgi:hypothetical protein